MHQPLCLIFTDLTSTGKKFGRPALTELKNFDQRYRRWKPRCSSKKATNSAEVFARGYTHFQTSRLVESAVPSRASSSGLRFFSPFTMSFRSLPVALVLLLGPRYRRGHFGQKDTVPSPVHLKSHWSRRGFPVSFVASRIVRTTFGVDDLPTVVNINYQPEHPLPPISNTVLSPTKSTVPNVHFSSTVLSGG